jgi:hypothetical protein
MIAAKEYWNNNEGWVLIIDNGRGDVLNFTGPTIGDVTTDFQVDDGDWHHAIGTYDDEEGVTRLFHNGSEVGTKTGVSLSHTTLPFHSGIRNTNAGDDIGDHSTIDVNDLRLYRKAVSATEASNLCETGSIHG